MMQVKSDLERWYQERDPWQYRSHPDDHMRKSLILSVAGLFGPYARALDVGAGEGYITEDLPASVIHGIELSDAAAYRFPKKVKRVPETQGTYDLILASGVLYPQYDYEAIAKQIEAAAHTRSIILTCNIKDWEIQTLPVEKQLIETEFPYREYTEVLRVYRWR